MFQHVKTSYSTVNVTRKRLELVPANHSSAMNETDHRVLDHLQNTTTTSLGSNVSDVVRRVVTFQEEVVVRELASGNGINVLGNV